MYGNVQLYMGDIMSSLLQCSFRESRGHLLTPDLSDNNLTLHNLIRNLISTHETGVRHFRITAHDTIILGAMLIDMSSWKRSLHA